MFVVLRAFAKLITRSVYQVWLLTFYLTPNAT